MFTEEVIKTAIEVLGKEDVTIEQFKTFLKKVDLPKTKKVGLGASKGVVSDYPDYFLADWFAYMKIRENYKVTVKDMNKIRELAFAFCSGKKSKISAKFRTEVEEFIAERNAVILYLEGL